MRRILGFTAILITLCHCTSAQRGAPEKTPAPEMPPYTFDHTYTYIEDLKDFTSLKNRGFTLSARTTNHPGVTSHFLFFPGKDERHRPYLEWGHNKNLKALAAQELKEGGDAIHHGIGFISDEPLDTYAKKIEPEFKDFGLGMFHKNYDWEKNNTDRLPGWNFLSSKISIVKTVAFFGIQYDPRPAHLQRQPEPQADQHTNTAEGIQGVILALSPEEYQLVQKFVGIEVSPGIIKNHENFVIIEANHFPELQSYFKSKEQQHWAVILKVKDLKTYVQKARPEYHLNFHGAEIQAIRTKNYSWDIWASDKVIR